MIIFFVGHEDLQRHQGAFQQPSGTPGRAERRSSILANHLFLPYFYCSILESTEFLLQAVTEAWANWQPEEWKGPRLQHQQGLTILIIIIPDLPLGVREAEYFSVRLVSSHGTGLGQEIESSRRVGGRHLCCSRTPRYRK